MHRVITCLILLMYYFPSFVMAQTFEVASIIENGPREQRINIIILGDGYQEAELQKFTEDATTYTTAMFSQTPYKEYKNYFNVYAIKVPSNESGASHPGTATDVTEPSHPVETVDNYFGSSFDMYNIHRLIVPEKTSKIIAVLAENFPQYDQVIILVNSPYYGGSGGTFATATLNTNANEIAIHELGHSFAKLKDEYWVGDSFAMEAPNMTQETDVSSVKWANWIGDNGIALYQYCCGGDSALWYRPHQKCKMRYLNVPFCAVCIEGTIERIHELVNPILSFSPDSESITLKPEDLPLNFEVSSIETTNKSMVTDWTLNGNAFAAASSGITLTEEDLTEGENTLIALVEDQSEFLRVTGHYTTHTYAVQWHINYSTTLGITDIKAENFKISVRLYPNPSSEYLTVNLSKLPNRSVSTQISDLNGKIIQNQILNTQSQTINISTLTPGTYFVSIIQNGSPLYTKRIIKT